MSISRTVGKVAYGVLFVIAIPALLVSWAHRLDRVIPGLPAVGTPAIGWTAAAVGFAVMAAGWWALVRYGEGLPMNIAPPERLVTRGIYRFFSQPIYAGFSLLTAGYFMAADVPAGFWIVTPCVVLGCATIVYGYERHDMKRRFGATGSPALLHFPDAADVRPSRADRVSAYVLVLLPGFALPKMVLLLGPPPE